MTGTCVLSLTDADFEREVLAEARPVLLDFYSTDCRPCQFSAPVLEQICADMSDELKVIKVNIEQCPLTARSHDLRAVPTFILYRGGKIIARTTGFGFRSTFMNWLTSSLNKP